MKSKYLYLPLLSLLMLLLVTQESQAQKYRFAAGWRAGYLSNGVTAKLIPVDGLAIEGIYNVYPFGSAITGLVESSRSVFCIQALQFYAGIGGHYRWNYFDGSFYDPINGYFEADAPPGTRGWGLDAIAGIELKIPLVPIAIHAEVKPMVEWTDQGGMLYGLDPGVGLKVTFGNRCRNGVVRSRDVIW